MNYEHKEGNKFFEEAFASFDELRKGNVMTDIVLTTINYPNMTSNNEEDFFRIKGGTLGSQNVSKVSKKLNFWFPLIYKYIDINSK